MTFFLHIYVFKEVFFVVKVYKKNMLKKFMTLNIEFLKLIFKFEVRFGFGFQI